MITGGLVSEYVMHLQAAGRSPGTIKVRRRYVLALGRQVDLLEATPSQLTAFCARQGWAPETRKSAVVSVRGFYRWAVDAGHLERDPSGLLPSVRVPLTVANPVPDDVVAAARAATDVRGRLLIDLAFYAGLRRSEIAQLAIADIVGGSLLVRGKGGRQRWVPLRRNLKASLTRYTSGRTGWVFPGQLDGHLSPGHVGVLLSRMLGPGWSGHKLRHAAGTRWYQDGGRDLLAVQALLGHAQVSTVPRYIRMPDDALRRAVDA